MKLIITVTCVIIIHGITGNNNCDTSGILLYEDMGCKPNYAKNKTCPSSFVCPGLNKSEDICYFKDKTYKIDEQIDSKLTAPSCNLGCICEKENKTTKFKCAVLDCPEWLGSNSINSGCYRKYELESCCSVREICPPYDSSTKCVHNGKEYNEGENFLPVDSCWRCVCQEGFNGTIVEPYCRRRACGVQAKFQDKLQNRCAPLYYRKLYREVDPLCCPFNWICPEGNENIMGKASSEEICYFGERNLKVGQGFKKYSYGYNNITVSCNCSIPPLLTCITLV